MNSWVFSLTVFYLLTNTASSIAQDGRCSKKTSRTITFTQTFRRSSTITYYEKCGLLNIFTCTRYKLAYSTGTRLATRIGYITDYECCPGWITDGDNCLPTQAPTTERSTTTVQTTEAPTTPTTPRITSSTPTSRLSTQSTSKLTTESDVTKVIDPVGQSNGMHGGHKDKSTSSLLENRTMMMTVSGVAVLVFLAMTIGGIVCAVKKFCPKKKKNERRLERGPSLERGNQESHFTGTTTNGLVGNVSKAKPKAKANLKSKGSNLTSAFNPGYDLLVKDELSKESTYEEVDNEECLQKPENVVLDFNSGSQAIAKFSNLKQNFKDQSHFANRVETENEYVALEDDSLDTVHKKATPTQNVAGANEATAGPSHRKPLPKPKPKAMKELKPVSVGNKPPSANNHLLAPIAPTTQYLDMSKGQSVTSSPTPSEKSIDGRNLGSPMIPKKPNITKVSSFDKSPGQMKRKVGDFSFTNDISFSAGANNNVYDYVGESGSEPSSRRGSDAKTTNVADGGYVLPDSVSPACANRRNKINNNDTTTCTYLAGDQMPGASPRLPILSDSYDVVGITGSSNLDFTGELDSELDNHYDLVMTQENRRLGGGLDMPVVTKLGYATPRNSPRDLGSPYENQRRSSASLPQKNRKQSLPFQPHDEEDVYDIVEVKDSHAMTTGRPPKVTPKKQTSIGAKDSQKTKAVIERSRSGPSLLRYAEFDSVYVNTTRF